MPWTSLIWTVLVVLLGQGERGQAQGNKPFYDGKTIQPPDVIRLVKEILAES